MFASSGLTTAPCGVPEPALAKAGGVPSLQTPQDVLPEPTAQQREDTTIADTFLDPLHQRLVRDAVEVALKVGIDHVGEAVLDQVIHLA